MMPLVFCLPFSVPPHPHVSVSAFPFLTMCTPKTGSILISQGGAGGRGAL